MYIVDDPMLALITRFMCGAQNREVSDAEFLLRQIAAIERYVEQFPDSERDVRAMEWIGAYAQQYRRQWQKKAVAQTLAKERCPDCPLAGESRSAHCEIHAFWLKLLQHYIADEISSREYAENTLKLLDGYKNRLKVGLTRKRLPPATTSPQFDPAQPADGGVSINRTVDPASAPDSTRLPDPLRVLAG
ncbi:MAG: hypothetical protein H6974_13830 [Gammaproteobacteria bacterium]|nr:hypothetical protein [Gammaproteobacteria bacterium]MCP5197844.1 hypothetical protein [Gammaproteobacteria bacterium]